MDTETKKLNGRLEKIIDLFNQSQYPSIAGLNRDRYYYIQKKEELALLEEEIQKATERIKVLNDRIYTTRLEVFLNWRNDFRILSKLESPAPVESTTRVLNKTIL